MPAILLAAGAPFLMIGHYPAAYVMNTQAGKKSKSELIPA